MRAVEPLPLEIRWERARASLSDPVRAVRFEAASLLADMPEETGGSENVALKQGWADYIAAKQFVADRAEERTNLAGFYMRQGKGGLAEQEYLAAIKLAPKQVPPRVNLADLYRSLDREAEAENLLRETIALEPEAAAAHHALGLTLVRQKRYEEAAGSLKRANELEPAQPRYAYVYAVALQSARKTDEARHVLTQALAVNPSNVDILGLLIRDALTARDLRGAASYGERLRRLRPDDSDFGKFVDQLEADAP
ncbi:MAG: tetratricopeptide repeat protein [Rhodomicrobium sp.]